MKLCNDKRDYYRNVYLTTEHWKNVREEKLTQTPFCQNCGSTKHLEPHHIRYKNVYDVELNDLKTLCRKCHIDKHKQLNQKLFIKNQEKEKKYIKKKRRRLIKRIRKVTGFHKNYIRNVLLPIENKIVNY